MHALELQKAEVVPAALDQALRTALGTAISGISTGDGQVTVWFFDPPDAAQVAIAQAAVTTQDPAVLTSDRTFLTVNGKDRALVGVQLPYTTATSVVVLVNGEPLPALPLVERLASFTLGAEPPRQPGDTLTLTVQGHPCEPLVLKIVTPAPSAD